MQLIPAQVDRHTDFWQSLRLPVKIVAAGLADHPLADRNNQTRLFGNRDKISRVENALCGMLPTDQGFHCGNFSAERIDLGLVINHKLVALERLAKSGFHFDTLLVAFLQVRFIDLKTVPALGFGTIHGRIGFLEQQ